MPKDTYRYNQERRREAPQVGGTGEVSADEVAARGYLWNLQSDELLLLPEPERDPGSEIRLVFDKTKGVFREVFPPTEQRPSAHARVFSFGFIMDHYIAHKDAARVELVGIKPPPPHKTAAIETPDSSMPIAELTSEERQLQDLVVGEHVLVYDPDRGQRIRLQKTSPAPEARFMLVGAGTLQSTVQHPAVYLYPYAAVAELIRANPAVVEFEESAILRAQDEQRKEFLLRFDRPSTWVAIIINGKRYSRLQSGEYQVQDIRPQTRKGGTRMFIQEGMLERAQVRAILQRATNMELVHFTEQGNDGREVIQESDEELERLHTEFANILPGLYPGITSGVLQKLWKRMSAVGKNRNLHEALVLYLQQESNIEQGSTGVCFALGGLHAIKRTHPELYVDMLARTIRKVGDIWQMRFLGVAGLPEAERALFEATYPGGWIPITEAQVAEWQEGVMVGEVVKGASQADKADIILERAYLSYCSFFEHGEAGHTFSLDRDGLIPGEGGFGHQALFDLLGPLVAKYKISDYRGRAAFVSLYENGSASDAVAFLTSEYGRAQGEYIATAGTPAYGQDARAEDKYILFSDPESHGVRRLPKKHAFSLLDFRVTADGGQQVKLADPQNTRTKTFWMNLSNFIRIFSQISYVRLQADFRRTDPKAKEILQQCYAA